MDGVGTINYSVTATDPVTTLSTIGTAVGNKDTLAPAAPAITQPSTINTGNESAFSVSGVAEPSSTTNLSVTDGATTVTATTTTNGSGAWSFSPANSNALNLLALSDGNIVYSATATDAAGNTSNVGFAFGSKNTATAAPPQITQPGFINPANEHTFTITGTSAALEGGIVVTVTDGTTTISNSLAPVSSNGSGIWVVTLDLSGLSDGANNISIQGRSGASLRAHRPSPSSAARTR